MGVQRCPRRAERFPRRAVLNSKEQEGAESGVRLCWNSVNGAGVEAQVTSCLELRKAEGR